jgi:sucrose-6F-phosphate phosphohydrolase
VSFPVLICTDLDGTLIPDGSADESPLARERFVRVASHPGVILAYVTGRHRQMVEEAMTEYQLPLPQFVVGDVGATVYDLRGGSWLRLAEWSESLAADWPRDASGRLSRALSGIRGLELQEDSRQHEFKVSWYVEDDGRAERLLDEVRKRLAAGTIPVRLVFSRDSSGTGLLDLLPPLAGKLSAVEFLIRREGLTVERALFAGDSGNDLEVLASQVPSVLVANAAETVRSRAVELARRGGWEPRLYLAGGGLLGMNGNFSAGILEGFAHFFPELVDWIH